MDPGLVFSDCCMDEFVVSKVHPNMADSIVGLAKEDQVSSLKFFTIDRSKTRIEDLLF